MKNYSNVVIVFLFMLFYSCSSRDNGAKLYLDAARSLYLDKQYDFAKQKIDSLKILYPKSFDQIKASLSLLDTIRRAENMQTIAICDSLIVSGEPLLNSMKKNFVLEKNIKYQDQGAWVPKESLSAGQLLNTTLRSGVKEDGTIYIESVFVGNKQKHNKVKVSTKDGAFVESLVVTADGLNYSFTNMGKYYEVIRFSGNDENGLARFIFSNQDKSLNVVLYGQGQYTYTLSQPIKSAISKSYQLSTMMLELDSLKTEKEKSEYRIYYLDNKTHKTAEDIVQ